MTPLFRTLLFSVSVTAQLICAVGALAQQEILQLERFGAVEIVRPAALPTHMVLWMRGKGEGAEVSQVKQILLKRNFILAVLDADAYLETLRKTGGCTQFGEVIRLSQVVQNRLEMDHLLKPVLFGSGTGAALAHAIAISADSGFSGLVTEEFCSQIPELGPFCDSRLQGGASGGGRLVFPDSSFLKLPGLVLKGTATCGEKGGVFAVNEASGMRAISDTGTKFDDEFAKKLSQVFPESPDSVQAATTPTDYALIKDLELVELPAHSPSRRLIIFFSGDGGWAAIDKVLGGYFQERGINVVGLSSLRYFWKVKTQEETAAMLANVIGHYATKWHAPEILLAGFSLGADVLPSAYNRLPARIKSKVDGMILLNPEKRIAFEVKLTDWLDIKSGEGIDALPEVLNVKIPLICVYGEKEIEDTLCTQLPAGSAQVIQLKGGHHFDGDYQSLGARLLELSNPITG